jgi:hypothetical protein
VIKEQSNIWQVQGSCQTLKLASSCKWCSICNNTRSTTQDVWPCSVEKPTYSKENLDQYQNLKMEKIFLKRRKCQPQSENKRSHPVQRKCRCTKIERDWPF